jgi:formate dehydrogenase major subunit
LVTRDNHLLRIEGDWDAEVNKGLLCVAGRFEALADSRERVLTPMVRHNGELEPATWDEALDVVADTLGKLDGSSIAAWASPRTTNETLVRFARLFKGLGARNVSSLWPVPAFLADAEGQLAALDQASLYLVVGEDLSVDHRVAGFAVRRGVMNRGARLAIIDEGENGMAGIGTYQFKPGEIDRAIALLKGADAPAVIYGAGAGEQIAILKEVLPKDTRLVGLVPGSNSRGALAVGVNGAFEPGGVKCAFVLAADDEVDGALVSRVEEVEFVVAQASYWSPLVERADVVLPTGIWAEKSGAFTNTEGRVLAVRAALKPPRGVKDDLEILGALAERLC